MGPPLGRVINAWEAWCLLVAPKDGGSAAIAWTKAHSPVSKALLSASLRLGVVAAGQELVVYGEWKGPDEQQLRLVPLQSRGNLARLCLTRKHGPDLHWHLLEDMPGLSELRVSDAYKLADDAGVDTLFDDVFAPTLRIEHVTAQGSFTS